ncbi:hypothetical protein [Cellulomonas xylanilytica]|uniref:Uncharacterized protein n=1 Tax=Cellulomonas xylanilytica TaxID=233583 RepID=A0A510UZ71_9CELL|nr:hypothetical protein [Cellulomonas xylanilytica]GEK19974.1 hypothetical protein CXY01_04940 [Cellulomonas xylanilytica]
MGGKTSTWIGGAVFVALLIMVGGWFIAISPTLDSAASATSDAEDAEARNDQLRLQLATLKKQFENLDEYKAELAAAQVEIPTQADLAGFTRHVDTLGVAAGLTVVSVVPGLPTDVAPVLATEPEAAPVDPAATAEGEAAPAPADGEVVEPAAPTGPAPIEGFVAVPVDVTVLGTVANATTFLTNLQAEGQRLFLVTGFRGTGQGQADASGGRPATVVGDVELTITGYIYVLKPPAASSETGAETETETGPRPALPVPPGATDPFTGA